MLLTLSISSSKAALELLISGHYSIAFASIRHMFEISIQCLYLEAFPEQHPKWYSDPETPDRLPDTPRVFQMCHELHAAFEHSGLTQEDTAESREALVVCHA